MNAVALSPRLSVSGDEFKLSDSRCVRWFLEALQLLSRFDETANKDALEAAAELLGKCVAHYPKDLLPRFYLGIAHRILKDMDQTEVIELFREFAASDRFEVRAAATYNLAASYIETYQDDNYEAGIALVDELVKDLEHNGAAVGQRSSLHSFLSFIGYKRIRVEQIYYQSLEARDYLDIHLNLWKNRWSENADVLEERAACMRARLDARANQLEKHKAFLGEQATEIWTWHWNNLGTLEESLAAVARREGRPDPAGPDAVPGAKAIDAYNKALAVNPRFDSSRSNLGRVYFELTNDLEAAVDVFNTALQGAEDRNYNNYWLGVIWTLRGKEDEALAHFMEAPSMLERREQQASWTGARKILVYELIKAHRRDEALNVLRKLEEEDPGDAYVKEKIAALTRDS